MSNSSSHASASSFQSLIRLFRYAKGERVSILLASFFSVLNKLFDVAPEILIGVAIDVVVNQEQSFVASLGFDTPEEQIAVLSLLTFFIWAGESVTEYIYQILWRNLAQRLQSSLRLDCYQHLQTLDMAFFDQRDSGELVAILNDDVNQLERFLDGGVNGVLQISVSVLVIGAIFLYVSPFIAACAFLPMPVIFAAGLFFSKKADPLYADVRDKVAVLATRLSNNIQGMATIKSFTAESYEYERLKQDSEAYVAANKKAIAVSSAFIPLVRIAVLSGFLVTFAVGGLKALNGEINVGAYSMLVFLTQRLLWPLVGLAEIIDLYARAMASTHRLLNILDEPNAAQPVVNPLEKMSVAGALTLDNMSFAYTLGRPVLSDISLNIPAGGSLGIVGATGSGKSTLVKLLLKYYSPNQGAIALDGMPYTEMSDRALRSHIGYVSQDVFLFPGSVRENLCYGMSDVSDEQLINAATMAQAWSFIQELPQGLDTPIGERGVRLSGGQRQRLSLARALLKQPAILILDEATSAIDNETEAAIQASIDQVSKTCTLIVVAHRLSTLVTMDNIVVLDKGQVVERGSHSDLLQKAGYYAEQWRIQTGRQG